MLLYEEGRSGRVVRLFEYVRLVQDTCEDSETVVRSDRWVHIMGWITSGTGSEPRVMCSGDEQVDR